MSDVQTELETLRREVADLKAGLEAARPPQTDDGDTVRGLTRRMKDALAPEDKTAVVGVLRSVVLMNKQGGNATFSAEIIYGEPEKLPSEQRFLDFMALFAGDPLTLRALYTMAVDYFNGKDRRWTKADLASALNSSESDLEMAMRPLVARDTVRWGKSADGAEYYDLESKDMVVLLLSFA